MKNNYASQKNIFFSFKKHFLLFCIVLVGFSISVNAQNTDGDNVDDIMDLDADNDGIVNPVEGGQYCIPVSSNLFSFNNTRFDANGQTSSLPIDERLNDTQTLPLKGFSYNTFDFDVTLTGTTTWGTGIEGGLQIRYDNSGSGVVGNFIYLQVTNTSPDNYADYTITFQDVVSNFNFVPVGIDNGDIFEVTAYNGASQILNTDIVFSEFSPRAGSNWTITNNIVTGNNSSEGANTNNNELENLFTTTINVPITQVVIRVYKGTNDNPDPVSIGLTAISYCTYGSTFRDTDDDSIPDYLDLDSDNDGIYDVVEAGHSLAYTDGRLDGGTSLVSGISRAVLSTSKNYVLDENLKVKNTDNPGAFSDVYPDYIDLDSDGDGCSDANEAYTDATLAETNQQYGQENDGIATVNENGIVSAAAYTEPGNADSSSGNAVQDYIQFSGYTINAMVPSNITVAPTNNVVITATINTDFPDQEVTHQWQVQVGSIGGWNNIVNGGFYSNATTPNLGISLDYTLKGNSYRIVVSPLSNVCVDNVVSGSTLLNVFFPIATNDNAGIFLPDTASTPFNVTLNDTTGDTPDPSTVEFTTTGSGGVLSNSNKTLAVANEGVWTFNNIGEVVFTPYASYIDTPTAPTYIVKDAQGHASNEATITLSNAYPMATNDLSSTYINTPVTVNLLANDSNPTNGTLTITTISTTTNGGSIVNNNDGTITYNPPTETTDVLDSFTYTICNDTPINSFCDTATVSISVYGNLTSDTDNDEVLDYLDLDDDNDGILDADEVNCLRPVFSTTELFSPNTSKSFRSDNPSAEFNSSSDSQFSSTETTGAGSIQLRSVRGYNYGPGKKTSITFNDRVNSGQFIITSNYSEYTNLVNHYAASSELLLEGIRDRAFNFKINVKKTGSVNSLSASSLIVRYFNGSSWRTLAGTDEGPDVIYSVGTAANPKSISVKTVNNDLISFVHFRKIKLNFPSTAITFSLNRTLNICGDTDNDGIPNSLDIDSDNDGIYDAVEAGHNQNHINGQLSDGVNSNGIPTLVTATLTTVNYAIANTDTDLIPDYLDDDSDADGCSDSNETYTDSGLAELEEQYNQTNGEVAPINAINGSVLAANYSTPADLDINGTPDFIQKGAATVIDTEPADATITFPANATFSVAVSTNTTTPVNYQWQKSSNETGPFVNIFDDTVYSNTDTSSLTVNAVDNSLHGTYYRVIVSSPTLVCEASVNSTPALLTVFTPIAATDDSYDVQEGVTTTTPSVFENDVFYTTIPSSASVTISQTNAVISGITLNNDGTITVENSLAPGEYTLNYEFCEIDLPNCDNAMVTINVDQAPVATDDESLANTVGDNVEVDVLINDITGDLVMASTVSLVDPGTAINVIKDVNEDIISFEISGEGTWSVNNTNGNITFMPLTTFNDDPTPVQYNVEDTSGIPSNNASITIDYVPIATADLSSNNITLKVARLSVLENDITGDIIDPSTLVIDPTDIDGDTNPLTLVVANEGVWRVISTGNIIFKPCKGDSDDVLFDCTGPVAFTANPTPISYTVDDDEGNSTSAQLTVTYTPRPPVAINDELRGIPVGVKGILEVVDRPGQDEDPDGALDLTTFQIIGTTQPFMNFIEAGRGTWSITNSLGGITVTFTPNSGFEGDPTPIRYTIKDNDGNVSNEALITFDYLGVANNDLSSSNTPNMAVTIDPLADNGYGTDQGNGDIGLDPTTVSLIKPTGATSEIIDINGDVTSFNVPNEGNWSVDGVTGFITFTPLSSFNDDPTPVQYNVEDRFAGKANVQSNDATITIDYVPIAADDTSTNNENGASVTVNVVTNDIDGDTVIPRSLVIDPTDSDTDGNPLTLVVSDEGTWTAVPDDGEITFTPEIGFTEDPRPITYTIEDFEGNSITATLTILYTSSVINGDTPTAVNDAPVNVLENSGTTNINVLLNDDFGVDGPNVGSIIVTPISVSVGTAVLNNGGTGNDPTDDTIDFTPALNYNGLVVINYTITDSNGDTSQASVIFNVLGIT
ncbi:Ig-like domain-containing protein, partial [Jejuia spongiicola]